MSNQNYLEIAARHNEAMGAFQMIYEATHPKPERIVAMKDNRFMMGVLLVIVFAAVVVSATHTVPIFIVGSGYLAGAAAFVMLEVALVALTYLRTRDRAIKGKRNGDASRWITFAVALVVLILIVSNIYYVAKQHGFTHPLLDAVVVVLVGVSAPALAFVCGEALALESVKTLMEQRELDKQYARELIAWQEGFNQAWSSRRKGWGAGELKVEKPQEVNSQPHSLNSVNERSTPANSSVNSPNGYTKNMNSRDVIKLFFEQHPERMDAKLDEILVEIERESGVKVGRTSIHNVRNEMKPK